jgi:hypothetical protein
MRALIATVLYGIGPIELSWEFYGFFALRYNYYCAGDKLRPLKSSRRLIRVTKTILNNPFETGGL